MLGRSRNDGQKEMHNTKVAMENSNKDTDNERTTKTNNVTSDAGEKSLVHATQ
jgi:hypothetical protein